MLRNSSQNLSKNSQQPLESKFPYGTVIITIDMESTIGLVNSSNYFSKKFLDKIQERIDDIIRSLLSLLENYSIPVTWGIVGRLFLEKEDIIKEIIRSPIRHDIGCHSFSHVNFKYCGREIAYNDIKKSIIAMRRYNIIPKSFIFPYNSVNYLDILAENGFITFRGKASALKRALLYVVKSAGNGVIGNAFLTLSQGLVRPRKESYGLWNIPGSMTMKRYLSTNLIVSAVKRGIDEAITKNKIFHFYFHDYDLLLQPQNVLTTEERLRGLESIVFYIDKKREEDGLQVITMSELAKYLNRIWGGTKE